MFGKKRFDKWVEKARDRIDQREGSEYESMTGREEAHWNRQERFDSAFEAFEDGDLTTARDLVFERNQKAAYERRVGGDNFKNLSRTTGSGSGGGLRRTPEPAVRRSQQRVLHADSADRRARGGPIPAEESQPLVPAGRRLHPGRPGPHARRVRRHAHASRRRAAPHALAGRVREGRLQAARPHRVGVPEPPAGAPSAADVSGSRPRPAGRVGRQGCDRRGGRVGPARHFADRLGNGADRGHDRRGRRPGAPSLAAAQSARRTARDRRAGRHGGGRRAPCRRLLVPNTPDAYQFADPFSNPLAAIGVETSRPAWSGRIGTPAGRAAGRAAWPGTRSPRPPSRP